MSELCACHWPGFLCFRLDPSQDISFWVVIECHMPTRVFGSSNSFARAALLRFEWQPKARVSWLTESSWPVVSRAKWATKQIWCARYSKPSKPGSRCSARVTRSLKQCCWRVGKSSSWGMAGAAGVEEAIWWVEFLSDHALAKHTKPFCGEIPAVHDWNLTKSARSVLKIKFPVDMSKYPLLTAICQLFFWRR
jgi:hypothetical protein